MKNFILPMVVLPRAGGARCNVRACLLSSRHCSLVCAAPLIATGRAPCQLDAHSSPSTRRTADAEQGAARGATSHGNPHTTRHPGHLHSNPCTQESFTQSSARPYRSSWSTLYRSLCRQALHSASHHRCLISPVLHVDLCDGRLVQWQSPGLPLISISDLAPNRPGSQPVLHSTARVCTCRPARCSADQVVIQHCAQPLPGRVRRQHSAQGRGLHLSPRPYTASGSIKR